MPRQLGLVHCVECVPGEDPAVSTVLLRAPALPSLPRLLRTQLSPPERAEFEALPSPRRQDWLSGRLALKTAYRRHRSLSRPTDLRDITVARRPSGAPGIEGEHRIGCSIAHTPGWGFAAVADCAVGIDLERDGRMDSRLTRIYADPSEVDLLLAAGVGRQSAATVLWIIKESVLKARASGLRTHPRNVRLAGRSSHGWIARTPEGAPGPGAWEVRALRFGPLLLAVARPSGWEAPA